VRSLWYLSRVASGAATLAGAEIREELERLRQRQPAFRWEALQSIRIR
jgi:hypothetical protein